jgi:glycosyltransferase involved in cell wall biosynthesis
LRGLKVMRRKVVMFANTDWYLYNFRRSLALAITALGNDVLMLSPDGEFGPRLRELGLRWEALPMERQSLRPDAEARLIWTLARTLRRERASVIHNFTIKCVLYGSLAAMLAGVPNRINAVTGLGYAFTSTDFRARALSFALKMLIPLATSGARSRVIVQNSDDEAALNGMGARSSQVRLVASSGVDCSRFSPRPPAAARDEMRVVYCGRLLWDKGLAELVEAARILRGRGLSFVVAGSPDPGNPAAVPIETIRDWESLGLVRFLGHVEHIEQLLATADVFVLPSYREGLPRSLIEAAACGLPLVATDVPGCREVVTDGVDGLLVPARDARTLAEAIWRLASNPPLAAKLGAAARERVVRCFDERIVIRQTLDVYEELLPGFASPI